MTYNMSLHKETTMSRNIEMTQTPSWQAIITSTHACLTLPPSAYLNFNQFSGGPILTSQVSLLACVGYFFSTWHTLALVNHILCFQLDLKLLESSIFINKFLGIIGWCVCWYSYCDLACVCVFMLSHVSRVWFLVTLWTVARQVPLSMGFSRQEYWRG